MSSRSTSPDPILLPSTPSAVRSSKPKRQSRGKPLAPRPSNVPLSSPSKSFVMDTGPAEGASPWRIKVTVQAEPQDGGSPSKRKTRTTKVPLKAASSSPAKSRRLRNLSESSTGSTEEPGASGRPARKRKGTPIRRKEPSQEANLDAGAAGNEDEDEDVLRSRPQQSSPVKRLSTESFKRKSLQASTERSKRLVKARKELDSALESAVGNYDDASVSVADAPGDMTVANEDFTMVSVETLQSMKQNTSVLEDSRSGRNDNSVVSVSYLPSSPPPKTRNAQRRESGAVSYPELPTQESNDNIIATLIDQADVMSWKYTGPAKVVSSEPETRVAATKIHSPVSYSKTPRGQQESERASPGTNNVSKEQVIVIDEDSTDQDQSAPETDDGDIWAEEASRSFEEEQHQNQNQISQQGESLTSPRSRSPQFEDLFAGQPLKPFRSKIPRTWRRTSGADFSYIDSPKHGALSGRNDSDQTANGDGAGSRSSGVLTPPSTDDEASRCEQESLKESDPSLTQPDAVGTQLGNRAGRGAEDVVSPGLPSDVASPSSESTMSPDDGDDTGLFWQTNLPNVFRRERPRLQRQRALDISELLAANGDDQTTEASIASGDTKARSSASKKPNATATGSPQTPKLTCLRGIDREKPIDAARPKVISSPLRKSLLKSSKVRSTLSSSNTKQTHMAYPHNSVEAKIISPSPIINSADDFDDSFASKASDHRQLLNEIASARNEIDQHDQESHISSSFRSGDLSCSYSGIGQSRSSTHNQSYEERLNLDSPRKIQVNFNDSNASSANDSNTSLLAPKRSYPALFNNASNPKPNPHSQPTLTLVEKRRDDNSAPGLFSRLSTNFWAAVVRPTGPTSIAPPEHLTSDSLSSSYSPTLRTQLRNRYGVLASQHPWTLAHMRTLHRMVNSSLRDRVGIQSSDSLVPRSGSVHASLHGIVDTAQKAVTGYSFLFTRRHALVVHAFMQVLVPLDLVQAMEEGEVEALGDETARCYRGVWGGRDGGEAVFAIPGLDVVLEEDRLVRRMPERGGEITWEWVVRCIGNVELANSRTRERESLESEDCGKGRDYDDDDENEDGIRDVERSKILPRVRLA